jgi:hypothetical protein
MQLNVVLFRDVRRVYEGTRTVHYYNYGSVKYSKSKNGDKRNVMG